MSLTKDQKRAQNVVFDCGDAGRMVARHLIGRGAFVPGRTLLALFASCRRGARYRRVLLSFALGCQGVKPARLVEAQVRQMYFSAGVQLRLGRWPWLSRTPQVPPRPVFQLHCCAIGGSHPALLAFAGLARRAGGGHTLQVSVPSVVPMHSGDRAPRPGGFVFHEFSVRGERYGSVSAMRWSQSPTRTLLILTVETARTRAFVVIFKVVAGGGLARLHCARFAPGEPAVRACDVLDSGGGVACHVLYNTEGVHFWPGRGGEVMHQIRGFTGHTGIHCRGALPWRDGVYAVTGAAIYHVRPPRRALARPASTRVCRLTFRGFAFVGPVCVNARGDGLILLCNSPEGGRVELVGYLPASKELYTICNFASEQDYRGDDGLGVLANGSIVLCGREAPLLFRCGDAGGDGVYLDPVALTLGHPSPLLQTLLVSEGGKVRAVVSLHANGLVTVRGSHAACGPFRAASLPVY
jgi:hypothetical protein